MRINLLREMIVSTEARPKKFTSRILIQYHDLLLFILAYPPDKRTHQLAGAELDRLADLLPGLVHTSSRAFNTFRETGVFTSTNEVAFSWSFLRWFSKRFPDQIEIVWDENESAGAGLDGLLNLIATPVEKDGLLESSISTKEWFDCALGSSGPTALSLLVERIENLNLPEVVAEHLLEGIDLRFDWTIGSVSASRTGCRFPEREVFYHRSDLLRHFSIDKHLQKKVSAEILQKLPRGQARELIETARFILGSRARETDPVTYANVDEVYLAHLDRGIDIALYGMTPGRRLPIESFFGYVLAKNGVPAAYGGGWVFLDRCEIGINIFPEMRGGESAYLFTQLLRLYRDVFDIHRFTVDPFQFGADNADGLRSGAFWFYRRFGFEPIDEGLRDLANREWEKISRDRSYRSPLRVLKKLATAKLVMEVGDGESGDVRLSTPDLPAIGLAVTRNIGLRFGGDLEHAEESSFRLLLKVLGIRKSTFNNWPECERAAFKRFCPLVMMIDDLRDWSKKELRSLITLLRSKGGKREMRYAELARNHPRWGAFLRKIAEGGNPDQVGAD